jgi:hypothetical protein
VKKGYGLRATGYGRGGALLLLIVGACTPAEKKGAPAKECSLVGAQCEVSPGKLGTCIANMDGGLVCQSQH